MKMQMRTVGVLLVLALLAGCRREAPNSPEGAYRAFIEALQKGNTRKAWASLSAPTRHKVEERSKAIAEASKGVVRDEPELLLFQGTRPGPLGEVTQVKADENSAVLQVASASGPREVKLVKDSGKWLIDLSDTIPLPTPSPPGASERRDPP
jgi:hypothetical protein